MTLRIDNTDTVPHSITSPEAGVSIIVLPGTRDHTLLVKQVGKFEWHCAFPCDLVDGASLRSRRSSRRGS
jgi:hypothetical protein